MMMTTESLQIPRGKHKTSNPWAVGIRELAGLDPEKFKSVTPANSAVVMSAQLVLPLTWETITFLTIVVREQRSVGSAS